eukprot:4530287-Pyramimonas_sp.AAC.1
MGPRNAVLGGGDACGLRHWDLRWSQLCGHATLYWVKGTHAGCVIEPSVGLPMGPRSAVLGVGDACGLRPWDIRWNF